MSDNFRKLEYWAVFVQIQSWSTSNIIYWRWKDEHSPFIPNHARCQPWYRLSLYILYKIENHSIQLLTWFVSNIKNYFKPYWDNIGYIWTHLNVFLGIWKYCCFKFCPWVTNYKRCVKTVSSTLVPLINCCKYLPCMFENHLPKLCCVPRELPWHLNNKTMAMSGTSWLFDLFQDIHTLGDLSLSSCGPTRLTHSIYVSSGLLNLVKFN